MLLIKNYLSFSLPKVKNNKWTKILSTMYLIPGESGCGDFSYTSGCRANITFTETAYFNMAAA